MFFGTASSFIEIISSSETEANGEAILFLFGCSEVNSTWIITSGLGNHSTPKALFTCVVYTKYIYISTFSICIVKSSFFFFPFHIALSHSMKEKSIFRLRIKSGFENAVKNCLSFMEIQGNSMLLPIQGHPMLGFFFASTSGQGQTVHNIRMSSLSVKTIQQKVNTPIYERWDVTLRTFYLRQEFSYVIDFWPTRECGLDVSSGSWS